jgi:hypothetical protein
VTHRREEHFDRVPIHGVALLRELRLTRSALSAALVWSQSDDKESVTSKRNGPELIDCGRVGARTRGTAYQLLFENVSPPFDMIFLIRACGGGAVLG